MKILKEGCPSQDGFHMPAEYEPHKGTILIWPKRPGSWIYGAKKAREAFADVICAIAESETVYLLVEAGELDHAQMIIEAVRKEKNYQKNYPVHYMEIASDDAWARDVGPTFVVNGQGQVRGIDWCFNAWGGICDGLYADWEKDDKVASSFCRKTGYDLYDAHPFVLEGGAIHTDGEGTILVTESCLLSQGRNPELSKEKIGQKLKDYLGAEKIIWIPYGIYNDETNGHIDNVCAFTAPGHVVLAWTEDPKDPQYPLSSADLAILEKETSSIIVMSNAKQNIGNKYVVTREFNGSFLKNQLLSYNPYIIVKYSQGEQNRTEVHLPKHKATAYANQSLIGSNDDAYYIDRKGAYPFAIDIPMLGFTPVTERNRIDSQYPGFATWAKSMGNDCKDWYKK